MADYLLIAIQKNRDAHKVQLTEHKRHDFRSTPGLRQYAEPINKRKPSRKIYRDPTGDLAVGRASKKTTL